jgi:hypothetical protein
MHLQRCRTFFDKYRSDGARDVGELPVAPLEDLGGAREPPRVRAVDPRHVRRRPPVAALTVLPTQQHPQCVFMADTGGVRYKSC